MAQKKRIFGWLTVSFVALILLSYFAAPHILAVWAARNAGKVPITGAVLTQLDTSRLNADPGSTIAFGHRQFEIPWTGVDRVKTKTQGPFALVTLTSSESLLMSEPDPRGAAATSKEDEPVHQVAMAVRAIYGEGAASDDYTLWKSILSTQPGDLTLFTPLKRAGALNLILIAKAIGPATDDSKIFLVNFGEFKGFQFGDPSHHSKRMDLQLWDSNGEVEINFFFKLSEPAHTQTELNRIIRTMRYVKDAAPTLQVTENPKK
jgi:hypothetical protein